MREWMFVCVCAFGAQRLLSGSFLQWLAGGSTPRALDRYVLPHSAFYVSAGDLNTGPHVYTVDDSLLAE